MKIQAPRYETALKNSMPAADATCMVQGTTTTPVYIDWAKSTVAT